MFDKKKYQELVKERVNTDWEYMIDKICKDLITMITEDDCAFNDFIAYMQNDMTAEEYIYLSEISDEISQIKPSYKFVEAYRGLAKKYPKETNDYQIMSFIEVAEAWAEDES
ncbi:Uncharacterised protein [Anaerobiospirillum thomasii]|uniref:Uncharacterized protein n=1 Tax=Anaerobiospirillum thomasii TaxID=179995 RepID=A0A2X0WCM3_9GAMM|nr:hypothetical protein [Anaerobiospirillum thomasii]SPT68037.1 Uncharacterised protein [Anaerobiospirillum thomasii]SPT70506.1 Uncharacterised protein [Anaerobiospirillum thomasii]